MRLLIIDDEEHVIDTIRLLVDWSALGFDEIEACSDATAALDLVKDFQPNLVLTDMMMPKVHGTQLVEQITAVDDAIKIIVISGHSDFNYIQHTLRHGGIDYITKPIMEEQLQKAAEKAIEKIKEEGSVAAAIKKVHQLDPLYWEQVFTDILEGKQLTDQVSQQLSDIYKLNPSTPFRMGVLELKDYQALLQKSFSNDRKLMDFALKNVCQEVIDGSVLDGYVHRFTDDQQRMVILTWGAVKALDMVVSTIHETIGHLYDMACSISVSDPCSYPESVTRAREEVMKVVENKDLMQPIKAIYRLSDINTSEINLPVIDPNLVLMGIKTKSRSNLESAVAESLGGIRDMSEIREVDLREILASLDRCISYCCEKLDLRHLEWDLNLQRCEWYAASLPERIEKVFGTCVSHIMSAYMKASSSDRDIIEEIKDYLDQNYHTQLNRVQLSAEFGISKEHMSRQFKKRYGKTVVEYMTELRLAAACNHLKSMNLSIREVSLLVGYTDEKYFSKVFKKYSGMSPKDYRKGHR